MEKFNTSRFGRLVADWWVQNMTPNFKCSQACLPKEHCNRVT